MASICSGILAFPRPTQSFSLPNQAFPVKKNVALRVRSTSEGQDDVVTKVEEVPEPPAPSPPKKAAPSFSQILAFSGPGPERINGRLAMIGFVAAIGAEIGNGQELFLQLQNGGVAWFLGTSALLTLASVIPLFKGLTAESQSGSLMSSDAELWNGRFAMLGLVALALTEFVKGGALV